MTVPASERKLRVEIGGKPVELRAVSESPCRRACPAGIDVKRYVGQIAAGDFVGALETIRKHMPFPSACGRICLHPCETECARREIDQTIAIMHLKRFVSDYEFQKGETAQLPVPAPSTGKRVTIVGSGPAGLTAAHDLELMGHKVTVFERADKPGGMLTQVIPGFALPEDAVRRDIERIEKLGIEIRLNEPVNDVTAHRSNSDAVLIATGASGRWSGLKGSGWVEGGELKRVIGAVEFMKRHRACRPEDIHAEDICNVAVLGYGVQALTCARFCIRLGAKEVRWIIPFDRIELQPDHRLVRQAEEEGVRIVERCRPLAIQGKDKKIDGVRCVQITLSEPDHTGRRLWKPIRGTETLIECGTVIDAAYFAPDTNWKELSPGCWGTIPVTLDDMATSQPGIFAAGDVVSGPKSVVEAVALGHRAAAGIDRYLRSEKQTIQTTGDSRLAVSPWVANRGKWEIGTLSTPLRVYGWEIEDPARLPSEAYRPEVRPAETRKADFDEAELSFTGWQAIHEARRCLLCGPCEECAVCISACTRRKGVAEDESGNALFVRVPLEVAQSIIRDPRALEADDVHLLTAKVDQRRCRGCGVCEEICGYDAPRVGLLPDGSFAASIDILACKGCGTCVAACPSGAIDQGFTSLSAVRRAIWGGEE